MKAVPFIFFLKIHNDMYDYYMKCTYINDKHKVNFPYSHYQLQCSFVNAQVAAVKIPVTIL
jgi:hypothetical protein